MSDPIRAARGASMPCTNVETHRSPINSRPVIVSKRMTLNNSLPKRAWHRRKKLVVPLLTASLILVCTVVLLKITLQPFAAIQPRACSRLSFSVTVYKFGEASTEYDGQCVQSSLSEGVAEYTQTSTLVEN